MRKVSERYLELAKRKGRYPLLKIELYEGLRGSWTDNVICTISGADGIKSASFAIGITSRPDKFETGTAFCGVFEAVLAESFYSTIKYSQKIKVYMGFKDVENNSEEYVALGVFFVELKTLQGDGVHVTARDLMMYGESAYYPYNLKYPCTLTELYKDTIKSMGGTIDDDFNLPVEATVLEMPFTCTNTDVIYVKGETELDGKPYTKRQILAQIAKTQLGNVFLDGDGVPKFYAYEVAEGICDDNITDLKTDDGDYANIGVFYAYGDKTQKQIKDEETFGTIVFFTTLPIQNLTDEQYGNLREHAKKACGFGWKSGVVTRKGVGDIELGDRIDYNGKFGSITFFVSGYVMEWVNGSFDETIYSFAPSYESAVLSSSNTDASPSELEEKTEESGGGSEEGTVIEYANFIKEAELKYILHNYTYVDYIQGNKIMYGGQQNQIIVQGYVIHRSGSKAPNGVTILGESTSKTVETGGETPDIPLYSSMDFPIPHYESDAKISVSRIYHEYMYSSSGEYGYDTYKLTSVLPTGTERRSATDFTNYNGYGGFGFTFVWDKIYPPGSTVSGITFEFGYAQCHRLTRRMNSDLNYNVNTGSSTYYLPFGSLAEYHAAVALTYEPATLTQVNETTTEV